MNQQNLFKKMNLADFYIGKKLGSGSYSKVNMAM